MSREVKKNFNEDLDLIGGVTVIRASFDNQRSYRPQWFRDQTLDALAHLPGVKELSLATVKGGQVDTITVRSGIMALAVDDTFWQVRSFWPQRGRLFGAEDVEGHPHVAFSMSEYLTGEALIKYARDLWITHRTSEALRIRIYVDEDIDTTIEKYTNIVNSNMNEERVKPPRGLRGRFYTIEIKNAHGADVDIDSLSMLVESAKRKIR